MMSDDTARRVAELILERDELNEWLEALQESLKEHPEHRLVSFGNINVVKFAHIRDESLSGWEGELRLPRFDAIEMLERQVAWINQVLRGLGVNTPEIAA